jgi:hypothetical protein
MAYNTVSGTLAAAQNYLPAGGSIVANVVSGNLSTSDGASLINIPRVTNATNNALITNVGGDANTLVCESNLTFDGTALTVTGQVTASIGVSASYFEGDGSKLTGITASSRDGGIFTEIGNSTAYTTSSVQIGSSATPSVELSVAGASHLSGGLILKRTFTTGDYSVAATDYYLGVDTALSTVKLTLPQASTITIGQTFVVKDEGGNAANNNITISGSAADKIDGANSVVLESPYASISLYCDGASNYFIY